MIQRIAGIVLLSGSVFAAAPAAAQPVCNLTGEHLMSWPDVNPVWQFCWLRPADSSGTNGSGIEIRNVYYNGHLVMKRGHVPMLNVQYTQTSCDCICYRDWETDQVSFVSDNIITPHVYAEPTSPPVTECDAGGGVDTCTGGPDCFDGVAAEKLSDRLILTTQMSAGWYRYMLKWRFFLDGRIQPVFGFGAINSGCVSCNHKHHAYWRFDFDIDDPGNDIVTEGPNPGSGGGRSGDRPPTVILPTETKRVINYPGITWSVIDSATHRGYRIVPGEEVALPADTFSQGDFWALKYHANEIDDGGSLGNCPVDFGPWLNGEALSGDVVAWYRTGWLHLGGDLAPCVTVGPTLYPVGDWSP
ncbi:MAG TPA: hypothetical protein VN032_00435 [Thermoanaerobaculia bacterium]|jgi:hypothetical protein|nr:hypothetical protein [Thermoanaerobaculia bacterium]